MVKYVYDAWGNHAVLDANGNDITDENHIGNLNPFRYRGYFYDAETGLYYLQTRYYDPEVGRFITIDGIEYLDPETINGLNLYAYCGDNPVMRVDSTGCMPKWLEWLLFGFVAALAVVAIVVGTIFTGGALAAILTGAGIGFLVGAGGSIVSQGIATNWTNVDPMSALTSGLIGAAVGAITGAFGACFAQAGAQAGMQLGYNLSKATIAGINVGKAFSYLGGTKLLMSVGSFLGATAGTLIGGYLSNELANNIFGKNPTSSDNLNATLDGLIQGWILDLISTYFKWIG